MATDWFDNWGKERAIAILDAWSGASRRPTLKGPRKGDHLKNSASYALDGETQREITIDRRGKTRGVEVYVNSTAVNGREFAKDDFPRVEELGRRAVGSEGRDGNPGIRTGVNRNASLKPKDHEVVILYVRDEPSFVDLLHWYSGRSHVADTSSELLPALSGTGEASPATSPADEISESSRAPNPESSGNPPRRGMTLEELQRRLTSNAETGSAGELVAFAAEKARLRAAGCTNPDAYVRYVALEDVGAGFDIETLWAGERRHVEVKSTRGDSADFFMSENERAILAALGPRAWLYRVRLNVDGTGEVVERLQDPIAALGDAFEPVAWRVRR